MTWKSYILRLVHVCPHTRYPSCNGTEGTRAKTSSNSDAKSTEAPYPRRAGAALPSKEILCDGILILHEFDSLPTIPSARLVERRSRNARAKRFPVVYFKDRVVYMRSTESPGSDGEEIGLDSQGRGYSLSGSKQKEDRTWLKTEN